MTDTPITTGDPAEDFIDGIKLEFALMAFAACKEIARLRGQFAGDMDCPLCGSSLAFSTARSNGHFRVHCSRKDCLSAME